MVAAHAVTVLILQYNSASLTIDLLRSIEECDHRAVGRFTFVVMDNGSAEPRLAEIAVRYPWVQTVAFTENMGFAKAHNAAMARVDSDWVFLLNNDCILCNDAISRTVDEALERGVDFATCTVLNEDGSHQNNWGVLPSPMRQLLLNATGIGRLWRLVARHLKVAPVGYVNGAVLLLRVASLPCRRLFDESFFMYGEDLDLMFRLASQKAKGARFRAGRVIHLGGASARQRWNDAEISRQKWEITVFYLQRYFPQWQVWLLSRLLGWRRAAG